MARQIRELGLSKTVEIKVLNNLSTLIKFDINDSSLDNVLIHGLSIIYYNTTLSPSRLPILIVNQQYASFITLADPNNKIYNRSLPVELLTRDVSNITYIEPKLVSLRNSYIEFPQIAAAVIPPGGASMVVVFFFEKYDSAKHRLSASGELIS